MDRDFRRLLPRDEWRCVLANLARHMGACAARRFMRAHFIKAEPLGATC